MDKVGPWWSRRRAWAAGVLVLLSVCAVVAALLAVSPPAFVRQWWADERPSPAAGDPAPPLRKPPDVRIAVVGDTGTGDAAQRATVRQMMEQGRIHPYDALVVLGDLVYEDGDADLVGARVTGPFSPLLARGATLVPVLGNHDYESGEQREILAALGRQRSWYAEWVGSVRILVLDTVRVEDEAQTRWLRRTLAEATPPDTWTIAAMHHPAYSAGYHGSDETVRHSWSGLFARAGVPLVLAGHDHDYQRSTPQDGVTYVVSGAGAKLRPTGRQGFTAVSASTLHFVDLVAHPGRLVVTAIDQSGRLVDRFTLQRAPERAR